MFLSINIASLVLEMAFSNIILAIISHVSLISHTIYLQNCHASFPFVFSMCMTWIQTILCTFMVNRAYGPWQFYHASFILLKCFTVLKWHFSWTIIAMLFTAFYYMAILLWRYMAVFCHTSVLSSISFRFIVAMPHQLCVHMCMAVFSRESSRFSSSALLMHGNFSIVVSCCLVFTYS